MIAALTVPYNPASPGGFLIVEQRSRQVFIPGTGAWLAKDSLLTSATWGALVVGPKTTSPFASLTTWPIANYALLWANVGDVIPGDQLIAIPFGYKTTGEPYASEFAPLPMTLSAAGRVEADGWIMKAAPGVGTTPPTVPAGSLATNLPAHP